jgi:subtilisin-like proprotein convertase family protein
MRKNYVLKRFFMVALVVATNSFAQVGIGTTTPNAALDINATDSGVLVPRVALTDTNTAAPVINPQGGALVNGTLVWNTNTSGVAPNQVVPGYYYWAGSSWQSFIGSVKVENYTSSTPVEPSSFIPGLPGSLVNVGTNATEAVFDNSTLTRTINVTGNPGNIVNVTCTVVLSHQYASDVDIYLQSPSGQIIEFTTDNGGTGSITFNVTFSDTGAQNITSWTSGNVSGTYRPEGTLSSSGGITPTITSLAGFNGFSANGTWTLRLRDDFGGDNFTFTSFSLSLATIQNQQYRLIAEQSINYNADYNYSIEGNYSANVTDNAGAVVALTRSVATAGSIGTTAASLPGTVLNYGAGSPSTGTGNIWMNTEVNHIENTPLTNGTYFYQLWVKANVDTPTVNNEIFNFKTLRF